ncbi:response regulator transcription factor [Clostridium bornimense]|uniref:response regulator transcription factor n=1 Tax=Clostridium bornimense TaxID=1216932 RepID=UPI001C107C20|nr:response regulator transcription factor [Clostridium bornimense]MBU5316644.1 response regulator transcription factor [Clostridium bornimense]
MNRILLIEDETLVSDVIKKYLEKEGYEVYVTDNGAEALNLFRSLNPSMIILDLMLPDMDGEDICKEIRRESDVYIIMLTAKSSLEEKIEGLAIGADDYLVKPLSPRELVARVNAVFRRVGKEDEDVIIVHDGEIVINNEERQVYKKGEAIDLTPNEFDILYTLAKNKGKVFSREMLIEIVFGMDFEGYDRTVDTHIKNIRKKIEDDSKNPKYIHTVVKVGYKFDEK